MTKYVKSNMAHSIENYMKRTYHLFRLIYQVTVKTCIYVYLDRVPKINKYDILPINYTIFIQIKNKNLSI